MNVPPIAFVTVNSGLHPDSPTAGIQEAVDSLPDQGGVIEIPPGRYAVRRSIRLRSDVTLRGEGAATVLVRPAPVVFDLMAPAPAHIMEAVLTHVEGLQPGDEIWFQDATQSGWHSRHLVIAHIRGNRVDGTLVAGTPERCYAPDGGAWGGNFFPMIFAKGGTHVTIESLTIDGGDHVLDTGQVPDFTSSAVHGVGIDNFCVRHVTVRRWPSDGISAQGGNVTVTGCLVEDSLGHGFHPGSSIRSGLWTHNISRRNGWDGFYFCLGVRHTVVTNNLFIENRRDGIGGLADPDGYNVITGNVIARNGRRGIDAPRALGNIIANNLIQDNSQAAPGLFPGIRIEDYSGNAVTGNSCLDTQVPHTQVIGIEAMHPIGDNLISGNLTPEYPGTALLVRPRASLRRAPAPPPLDGRLDSAVWKAADRLELNRSNEVGAPLVVTAEAFGLYDDRCLYLGLRGTEPAMDRLRDCVRTRGKDCWRENAFEVYLAAPDQDGRYYQVAVNSLATVFESRRVGWDVAPWDSKAEAATFRGGDFWSATIAIPLASLGLSALHTGRELALNVYRSRTTAFPTEVSAWSPTLGTFNRIARYGTLVVM